MPPSCESASLIPRRKGQGLVIGGEIRRTQTKHTTQPKEKKKTKEKEKKFLSLAADSNGNRDLTRLAVFLILRTWRGKKGRAKSPSAGLLRHSTGRKGESAKLKRAPGYDRPKGKRKKEK